MSYDLPKSALEWKNKIHSFVQNELVQILGSDNKKLSVPRL